MKRHASLLVALSLAGPALGQTTWSTWANVGSIGGGASGTPYQWPSSGPSGSVLFGAGRWNAPGGWNIRVFLQEALGPNAGSPPNCQTSSFLQGYVWVEVRVPLGDLSAPGVVRPSAVQVRLSNGISFSPVAWRYVEVEHWNSNSMLFRYRHCFTDPPLGPLGEWGRDGSRTLCPTYGPQGVAEFTFSAEATVRKTTVGNSSGFVAGPADINILPSVYQDCLEFTLGGAHTMNEAWCLLGPSVNPNGYPFNYLGTPLVLYVNEFYPWGPFPVTAGRVRTSPVSLDALGGRGPWRLYCQWFAFQQASASMVGLSEAICADIEYRCN